MQRSREDFLWYGFSCYRRVATAFQGQQFGKLRLIVEIAEEVWG